jgi:hypothetical protein
MDLGPTKSSNLVTNKTKTTFKKLLGISVLSNGYKTKNIHIWFN